MLRTVPLLFRDETLAIKLQQQGGANSTNITSCLQLILYSEPSQEYFAVTANDVNCAKNVRSPLVIIM